MRLAAAWVLCGFWVSGALAIELKPETVQAFDRYIRETEARQDQRLRPGGKFLWVDERPGQAAQVRQGQLAIENRGERDTLAVPGGLIHDWFGAVFVPGVTLAKTLALVQDYGRNQDNYKPEVLASRLVSRTGNDFHVYMRLMKQRVVTVILDTEYDVRYFPLDGDRCYSRAYSTRIAQVENAGKPDERTLPSGKDDGFLWRLYSYWRFQERDGGVYVECEAISLTRGIPAGLGWLIEPIVTTLPRESLANTLQETRAALLK
ncbi:MAG: hypothetical protein ABSG65_05050 [Bryobacteraceae bacterium]|jgi:hypothetical protein